MVFSGSDCGNETAKRDLRRRTKATEVSTWRLREEHYVKCWLMLNSNSTMPFGDPCCHPGGITPTHAHIQSKERAKNVSSLPAGTTYVTSVLFKSLQFSCFESCNNFSLLPFIQACLQPSHFPLSSGSCSALKAAMACIRDEWVWLSLVPHVQIT